MTFAGATVLERMERSTTRQQNAPPIAILGVPFDNVTTTETIRLIEQMVASRRPHYMATANVDFLVQALHDVELRRILFEAHLVLCDGTPLLWASRLLGNKLAERVAGSDLVPLLIKLSAEKGYRLFFLGGTPEATSQAVARLQSKYPKVNIAGYYSPPFSHLLEMDHDEIKRRIQQARPDLLFVSFGCPKQEKWIAMHYRTLGVPVAVGVGATIDFLAGRLARAPMWMRKLGLEWVFRAMQEPRRLGKRYLQDVLRFGGPFLDQWWRLQFRNRKSPPSLSLAPPVLQESWEDVKAPDWLDMEVVHRHGLAWQQVLATHRNCLMDLRNVKFIDSTGVGLLIRMQKRARITGGHLVLIAPSEAVRRALSVMRLLDFFDIAEDIETARRMVTQDLQAEAATVGNSSGEWPLLLWQGEVTAGNADQVWKATESFIAECAPTRRKLVIDVTKLRFIDSTGVGLMIRAKKFALQQEAALMFHGVQENVRSVLRLSKLEAYLLGESK